MKKSLGLIVLGLGYCLNASADIWVWVDADGESHYVSSNKPIWTWMDAYGQAHYSDVPESEFATRVTLVWHSSNRLSAAAQSGSPNSENGGGNFDPDESDEERQEREIAEAYYCNQAKEIYDTYLSAPRLFKTTDDGQREYLSVQETVTTLAETKAKVDNLCG